ncbi:hypothetical protein J1N51_02230 [Psychrosphaera ytuae]|uniref:PhoD-like phosphatase metallophosphatase domain-containing protein n=1 Tax=Psychrosphaera ytuae TaxID=2820710 RepID=A0A975DCA8_9GAMM|nr:hypothetical protein [Psychrosphaera ytuae]QTH64324.1 hypothetical protein J1N51_02230 [Psychrosphaera ytuae]
MTDNLLCGPFLRLVDHNQVNVWFVTSEKQSCDVKVFENPTHSEAELVQVGQQIDCVQLGVRCFVYLCTIKPDAGTWISDKEYGYELHLDQNKINDQPLRLQGYCRLSFKVRSAIKQVIQGSCRKPDHPSVDAFNGIAEMLNDEPVNRPDYLLMTGDQIYADDVAAPMLVAIQSLVKKLGLYTALEDLGDKTPAELSWTNSINERSKILPNKDKQSRWSNFWHGSEIISARYHDNHLISLNEFFACYLLTWSSKAWALVEESVNEAQELVAQKNQYAYDKDWQNLRGFISTLPDFELTLANIPTLMIFDDHDVTDDWNLSADWEEHIYGNDFTRKMIKNALLSYAVFQSWGNNPEKNRPIIQQIQALSHENDFSSEPLTEALFDFSEWHFEVQSQPKIVVLDTRTHRWRSEKDPKNPSGLMDFPRLEEFERQVFKETDSILVVSPAPVFGVKSIEVVQKICAFFGKELLVDVENWMAHQGSAKKLMNILRDERAPDEIIIMSGDVHYSFCFSAERRFSDIEDRIWQLTCSGFKNQFPPGLLKFFDYVDRFLYSPHSILNIFTKRRRLEIEHHPLKAKQSRFRYRNLHTQSAAGLVTLNEKGLLADYSLITPDNKKLYFDLTES